MVTYNNKNTEAYFQSFKPLGLFQKNTQSALSEPLEYCVDKDRSARHLERVGGSIWNLVGEKKASN